MRNYNGFIVNENGDNVKVVNGNGDDGCHYELCEQGNVQRIQISGDNAGEVLGEFDPHDKPYVNVIG